MALLVNVTEAEMNVTSCAATRAPPRTIACNDAILDCRRDTEQLLFYTNAACAAGHSLINFVIDNRSPLISSFILLLLVYFVYKIYWDPVCYVKELTEVGFEHIPAGAGRGRRVARAQAARRAGAALPPPYPDGWFAVAESRELVVGDVKAVDALGENLCVYRGSDGVARVVGAYCPHLGANLGVGGRVCGDRIECPFHKWQFGTDGTCLHVPGAEAPKGVSIKTWRCEEAEGAVWIWHDAAGGPPRWALEDPPECKRWGYRGRNEFMVSAHIQEIPENGADVAHLNAVHSPSLVSALGDKCPFLKDVIGEHVWSATWSSNGDHSASITLTHHYRILKYQLFHLHVQITQLGPGHVRLRLRSALGEFLLSQSVTPVAPLLQRVVHRLYCAAPLAPLAPALLRAEGDMIERDIRIWNSKRFVGAPAYVKLDKSIRVFRSWYAQFYSEHSRSYRDCARAPLDW